MTIFAQVLYKIPVLTGFRIFGTPFFSSLISKAMQHKTTFSPGVSLTLFKAPTPLRIYYWIRQFPTTTISVLLVFLGIALTLTVQAMFRDVGDPDVARLGFFPIAKTPFLFDGFKPETEKDKAVVAFVKRFQKTAKEEAENFGQPASVALAQGIVESDAGRSQLSRLHNNFFGEKCFSRTCGKGHCVNYSDDHRKDFFKKFKSAWLSWRSHSKFLQKERYKPCFKKSNYKGWCKCLKETGYATDKKYDSILIQNIEKYRLYEFDK